MKPKILIYPGLLLMLVSLVTAFNLDVICPGYAFLPGDEVSCNLRLDEGIPESIFGLQFAVQAEGLTDADEFFQPFDPLVGSSGGLGGQTLLFTLTPFAVPAGNVAKINLEIPPGTLDGDYEVSLEDRIYSEETTFGSTSGIIRVRALGGPVAGRLGELNGDGEINVLDILLIIDHITGKASLPAEVLLPADTDCNGNINVMDIQVIINLIIGRVNQISC